MRLTTLLAFALGAATAYCLMSEAKEGGSEPAGSDPRGFGDRAPTVGSPVPPGGDPDLVGT